MFIVRLLIIQKKIQEIKGHKFETIIYLVSVSLQKNTYMSKHIVIMAKPPIISKVKTRLAIDLGDEKTVELYDLMLEKTFSIVKETEIDAIVFFTEESDYTRLFSKFEKNYQAKGDLGDKMNNAFKSCLRQRNSKVVMIGTDCPDNSSENILKAFDILNEKDIVFGPSEDGGYYLIGMKKINNSIFENKTWSTSTVLEEALSECELNNLSFGLLKEINDIDTMEDLKKSKYYKKHKTID